MEHVDFILRPLYGYLEEAIAASKIVPPSIASVTISDYILDSVFLKITGAQEQKLKCIVWSLATVDYEYRYERFSRNKLGECSHLDEKNSVYFDILKRLIEKGFVMTQDIRKRIFDETITSFLKIVKDSNWLLWKQSQFEEFMNYVSKIGPGCICSERSLFTDVAQCANKNEKSCKFGHPCMKEIYKRVYNYRNRTAHNTESYQNNIPSIRYLSDPDYKYENVFIRFFYILLIDNIFMCLFREYLSIR